MRRLSCLRCSGGSVPSAPSGQRLPHTVWHAATRDLPHHVQMAGQTAAVTIRTMNALVLGGTGFIGRRVVLALLARGARVTVGTRHPQRAPRKLPAAARGCRLLRTRHELLLQAANWSDLLASHDTVVNCVGILRQRGAETYERVHHLAPAALAAACARAGARLVHVSALGLRADARSGFITSKLRGEQALAASAADYSIARPSLLDGDGGFGALWLRRMARWPLHLVPASSIGRLAPLQVAELGEALANLAALRARGDLRTVELGGPQLLNMPQLVAALRAACGLPPAACLRLPHWLARAASHGCDLLHATPLSFGHLELLMRDNTPRLNHLPLLLGRAPTPIGLPPAGAAARALPPPLIADASHPQADPP